MFLKVSCISFVWSEKCNHLEARAFDSDNVTCPVHVYLEQHYFNTGNFGSFKDFNVCHKVISIYAENDAAAVLMQGGGYGGNELPRSLCYTGG